MPFGGYPSPSLVSSIILPLHYLFYCVGTGLAWNGTGAYRTMSLVDQFDPRYRHDEPWLYMQELGKLHYGLTSNSSCIGLMGGHHIAFANVGISLAT